LIGLSQNVSDYYYALGSKSALSEDMKKHCVGSQGVYHIFHLPSGPSMLELSQQIGDRRGALSQVHQLKHGMRLEEGYPIYELDAEYKNPLDQTGQDLEKAGVDEMTPKLAMDYLSKLTAFPTRSYSNSTASGQVEHWLKDQFEKLGMTACFHSFDNNGQQLVNVVGFVPGATQQSVTVGAHYDSRPFEGMAPGAVDNGSGVSVLLTMAKAFMKTKVSPKHNVYFVAFAGEEPGLIGSQHFATALKEDGAGLPGQCRGQFGSSFLQAKSRRAQAFPGKHRGIILDEIGWKSGKLSKYTVNLETTDELGKVVMDHLRHASNDHNGDDLEVVHNAHPYGSDHMSWLNNGMEAVLSINGDDEGYPFYHRSDDTINNVSPKLLSSIGKMNYGGLMRMCMI
jgi:Zn-dependent M28 family amino/carboxypeptidase